jgi:hypothetical protein
VAFIACSPIASNEFLRCDRVDNATASASKTRKTNSCKRCAKSARDELRAKNTLKLLVWEPICLFGHRLLAQGIWESRKTRVYVATGIAFA